MSKITIDAYSTDELIRKVNEKIDQGFEPSGNYYTVKNLAREQDPENLLLYRQDMIPLDNEES